MLICRGVVLLLPLLFCVVANANSLISGSVSSDTGRALAHISITLTGAGQPQTQLSDAFGRYQFASVTAGTYQLSFADENLIIYVDEDPYPDEGSVYSSATGFMRTGIRDLLGQASVAPDSINSASGVVRLAPVWSIGKSAEFGLMGT